MRHILEADSILLSFDERTILSNIYIKCETGKIIGLLGRNGQGKSCLLKVIYGTLAVESKSIRWNNSNLYNAYKRPDVVRYLPQFNFIPGFLTLKRVFEDFEMEYTLFEKLFPDYKNQYKTSINSLSGGGYRLVEFYIILRSNSHFVLMDEPFTHLSPLQIEIAKELLQGEKSKKGIIVTDHLFRHVTDVADQLYLIKEGKTHLLKEMEEIESLGYARL